MGGMSDMMGRRLALIEWGAILTETREGGGCARHPAHPLPNPPPEVEGAVDIATRQSR